MSMTEEFMVTCACLQVLTLTMSVSAGILKRGATPQSLQEEVQHVLELQQDDAAQQDTGSYQPFCMGPTALGVDDAILALQDSIDWLRLRSYALPGGADSPNPSCRCQPCSLSAPALYSQAVPSNANPCQIV